MHKTRSTRSSPIRRSPMSRRRARRNYTGYGLVAFVVVCAIGYVALAGWLGASLADRLTAMGWGKKVAQTDASPNNGSSMTPTATPQTATEKQTIRIDMPALDVYAIQLGAYSSALSADEAARTCQTRGGGGYVIEDSGRFKVLAAAYHDIEDARKAQSNLKSQGVESVIYMLHAQAASFNMTASEELAQTLGDGLPKLLTLIEQYGDLAMRIDRGELTAATCKQDALAIVTSAKAARAPMDSVKSGNELFDPLRQLYDAFIGCAEQTGSSSGDSVLAMSAKIKYNYLELLHKYETYMRTLESMRNVSSAN